MHLPELTLLLSRIRCLRSERGILVEREWVVLEDNAYFVTISLVDLVE